MFGLFGGKKEITWPELFSCYIATIDSVRKQYPKITNAAADKLILSIFTTIVKNQNKKLNKHHANDFTEATIVYITYKDLFDEMLDELAEADSASDNAKFDFVFLALKKEFGKHLIVMALK